MHMEKSTLEARFLKASFWTLFGAVGLRGLNIAGFVFLARILGDESFGKFGTVQGTITLLVTFSNIGLAIAVAKFVAEFRTINPQKSFDVFTASLLIGLVLSGIFSIAVFVLADTISVELLNAADMAMLLRISSVSVFFLSVNNIFTGVFNGYEEFKLNAFINTIRGFLNLSLLVLGVKFFGLSGGIACLAIIEILVSILYIHQLVRVRCLDQTRVTFRPLQAFRENGGALLRFCIPLFIGIVVTTPVIWLSKVYLANQPEGYSALGIFNAAEKWYQLVLFVPSALSVFILPLLSNLRQEHDSRGYYKIFFIGMSLNIVVVMFFLLIMVAFSDTIMGLFGSEFTGSTATLNFLLVAALGTVLNTYSGQFLLSRNLVWLRMFFDLLLGFLLLGSALMLIPHLFDRGLAISYAISYSVVTILLLLLILYITMKDLAKSQSRKRFVSRILHHEV